MKTYSRGMQRRLDIAASIVVTPALLFLDEPTTGLEPHSRSQVWEMVRWLVREGTTVLLTTQYLDEADRLADSAGVRDPRPRHRRHSPPRVRRLLVADPCRWCRLQPPRNAPRHRPPCQTTQACPLTRPAPPHDA